MVSEARALDGHDDVGHVHGLALLAGNCHHQSAGKVGARTDGFGDTAQRLDTDDFHRLARDAQLTVHALGVGTLAAQADNQKGDYVGTVPETDQGFGHPVQIGRHLAAAMMVQVGYDALHLAADGLGNVVGAGDAGKHGHKVARAELSVGARISH